ncbi:MAG: hypothetical protein K8T20_05190, partial [Planctomycetes bacterium]|nr:hypothetical protein [Planctomycetota bacterium]
MNRLLPVIPFLAFSAAALAALARLGALSATGSWALTVAMEGLTVALVWGGALGLGRLAGSALLGKGDDPFEKCRAPAAA